MRLGLRAAQRLGRASPALGTLARRSVLSVWWLLTGQIGIQYRAWRQARRTPVHGLANPPLLGPINPAAERINILSSQDPVVSVIIPTHGQAAFTLRCLAAIAGNPPMAPIEVIVIDDHGPPADAVRLDPVRGIRRHRNTENLGFIGSCNHAAKMALGRYLLFLNNDTEVQPNWLDPMLALIASAPDIGAVGAKLLYPDGRLQEAGGIIWRDGTGWNFGRGGDPDAPPYDYVREVDYCSGAALMVPADLFHRLGGFDPRYKPAYFEDADLSFRLREIGYRTLYQPAARVIHHEGVSHGTDLAAGIKAYQLRNRALFVQRWRETLNAEHEENGANVARARERAQRRRVVLVIDHYVPRPDRDAGSRTMWWFLRALRDAGMVVKFWPWNLARDGDYSHALRQHGIEVFDGPNHPELADWLREHGGDLDDILLSRPDIARRAIPPSRAYSRARLHYYGHDLHFRRMRQQGEVLRDEPLLSAADRMEDRERAVWRAVDTVLYPSEEEARMARAMEPAANARLVTPYAFDHFATDREPPAGKVVLFVAGFAHPPNQDAALWLARDIMPRLRALVPNATLAIVGSAPTAAVRGLAGPDIAVRADVDDAELADWYATARAAAVPLRFGAGVKLKVVEALTHGLPLVTTPIGAQGLDSLATVVPCTTDADEFAMALRTVLTDDAAWRCQSHAQARYAAQLFSREALQRSLLAALAPVAGQRDTSAPVDSRAPKSLLARLARPRDRHDATFNGD
jgi:GT2 family glycosyltransferase